MGIIQKQSVKGTIYSYIGVGLGFVTTGLLLPHLFTAGENGVLKLLVSYSLLFAQFATLGFSNVIYRFFTFFRNKQNQHNGFFFIMLLVTIAGFILSVILFLAFKPLIIQKSFEKSYLFLEYVNYVLPLIFFTVFFLVLDAYYTVLYNAARGLLLKECIQRVFILLAIALFYYGILDFTGFVLAYVVCFALPTFIIIILLFIDKEVSIKPQSVFLTGDLKRSMANFAIFGLISGFAGIIVFQIDSIMISSYIGIAATGIYSITYFFGTLIRIPSRALSKISSTFLADAWKNNDISAISEIYKRSCLHQYIIGLLLFIGIWANIGNVFKILPTEFEHGKYVILFIGLANLIEMISGVNTSIISTSGHYKTLSYFIIIMGLLIIITNAILLPLLGITGAAVACVISTLAFAFMRYFFLLIKYKMQPYDIKFLIISVIGGVSYLISLFIHPLHNYIVDILIRSTVITIVFVGLIILFKISGEINQKIEFIVKYVKQKV